MKYKIMAAGDLDNIKNRMIQCCAVLDAIRQSDIANPLTDAIAGASDLLGRICDDFEADISAAEDYTGEAVTDGLLASPRQIRFLEARGFQHAETWSFEDAKSMIDRIAANGWRVPPGIIPAEYVPMGKEAAV